MNKVLVASLLGLVLSIPAYADGNTGAGKEKSAVCASCHGADGNSAVPNFPKLAGQHAGYLFKQLMDFKTGKRADASMVGMVAGLSEADMHDLAAFYASQKSTQGQAAEDQVVLGESIYRAGNAASGVAACTACHGPTGTGNPQAGFPGLGSQHAAYTADQLNKFAKSQRANDASSMMRMIAAKMSEAEIKAVAEYIQGLALSN